MSAPLAAAAPAAQPQAPGPAAGLTYRLVDTWSRQPWQLTPGRFGTTADISSAPDGTVYILDSRYAVVHVLERDGRPRGIFAAPPSAAGDSRWTARKLDVGFDGTLHLLSRGQYQVDGTYPHRVDRLRADGSLIDFFEIPNDSDTVSLYHDIGVRADGRIYLSRTGPDNPYLIWPGPTPTPLPPGVAPPDGVDVFGPQGAPLATLATSCMPDSLDLDQDGTLYVVNRCPAPFINPPPPANPEPEPSGRGGERGRPGMNSSGDQSTGASKQEAPDVSNGAPDHPEQAPQIPKREGVIVYAPDHAYRDFVPFNNPEEIAVGPAGAFVARNAEIFALRETAPLYSGPTAQTNAAFFGRVVFRLDVPADGELLASMNHCYYQGLVEFDDPTARPAPPRFVGALDNPELEGPPNPIRIAASDEVAVLGGRFATLGLRPSQSTVVMPFNSEAQTVQRWTRQGLPAGTSRLQSQLGLCSDSETWQTLDVAIDGRAVYAVDPFMLQRRPDDTLPAWTFWPAALAAVGETPWLAAAAAADGRVAALDIGRGKVVVLDDAGTVLTDWPIAAPDANAVPMDLALGADRVYVADVGRNRVLVRGLDGADLGEWPLHDGPLGMAVGPTGDLFVLGRGGWGMRYGPDGGLIALWPMPNRAIHALDLAVDIDGVVYVNFSERTPYPGIPGVQRGLPEYSIERAGLWVFAPAELPAAPAIPPGACIATPDKRARPARIPLGAEVDLRLEVAGACPGAHDPVQVIVAFDTSRSMNFDGALDRARRTLTDMLGGLDSSAAELGLVTFDAGATLSAPLSRDLAGLRGAILGLQGDGDTRMGAGIDLAARELTGPRGNPAARRIILVVSDGVFKDQPFEAATRARAAGIEVYALVFANSDFNPMVLLDLQQQIAGDADHVLVDPTAADLAAFVRALTSFRAEAGLFQTITIEDLIPRNMRYVPGSARPPAVYDAARHALVWTLADIPAATGVALDYTLEPLECGLWPTNIEATASYRDALGNPGRLVFPIPQVDVACETHRVYLPLLSARACLGPTRPLDVVLAIDASSSMTEPAPGGGTKLDAARAAASAFVDLLALADGDRAAVVAFNRSAARLVDLTGDRAKLVAGLAAIRSAEGTRIDLGLAAAADELDAGRRSGALPVVVLLTDGLQNVDQAPNQAVLAQADRLRRSGARVYTIGLGTAIDRDLLRAAATSRDAHYFESPTTGDLARIYAAISARVACEAGEGVTGGLAAGPVDQHTTAPISSKLPAVPRASPDHPTQPGATIATTEGPVVGLRGEKATAWKGIPFAAPPIGALRWRAPQPPAQRAQPLAASTLGPACPQDDRSVLNPAGSGRKGEEDCLTLNIWAPNDAKDADERLPVLFWIHGGGHVQGSGTEAIYDGASLAGEKNVVVVTINYRLGALGFLVHEAFVGEHPDHPTAGNWGRLDQIAALKWVRANIAGFGGDPERITIFGESAGGVGVCDLMTSPLARGLFAAAIMQSGNCLAAEAMPIVDQPRGLLPPATDQGRRFAAAIGCTGTPDVAACLRGKSVDEVLDTLPGEVGILKPGAETYGPIVDRHALVEAPAEALAAGREAPVPFMLGSNADEGTIFLTEQIKNMSAAQVEALIRTLYRDAADQVLALYPPTAYTSAGLAVADITGDVGFVCPARRAARWHAERGHPAFLYHFTYVSAIGRQRGLGAFHGSEIPFVFGNTGQGGGTRLPTAVQALSDSMRVFWTNLAANGTPGTVGNLAWPAYSAVADVGGRLDTPPALEPGWRRAKCDLWDAIAAGGSGGAPTAIPATPGTPRPTVSPTVEVTPTSTRPGMRVFMPYAAGG